MDKHQNHGDNQCYLCKSTNTVIFYPASSNPEGSPADAFLITDGDYQSYPDIYRCRDCSLIFSDPRADTALPLPYYEAMKDPGYDHEAAGRAVPFRSILKMLRKLAAPGKILDIGAATGIFLDQARQANWQVFGVEPSEWAVEHAREQYDLSLHQGTVHDAGYDSDSFQAVVLLDVIEHVTDPGLLLKEIHRILAPRGILVLTTPNIGSFVARSLGKKWWHIRRAHQYYFNYPTLVTLLRQSGFTVVKKRYYPWAFSLHYWISRFEHFLPPLYRLLALFEKSFVGKMMTNRIVKFNFYDSFELYLRKR